MGGGGPEGVACCGMQDGAWLGRVLRGKDAGTGCAAVQMGHECQTRCVSDLVVMVDRPGYLGALTEHQRIQTVCMRTPSGCVYMRDARPIP